MGDPTSSKAAAGLALRILEALKPPHPDLPFLRHGEDAIKGETYSPYLSISLMVTVAIRSLELEYLVKISD
jgi:hypothetical protein